MEQQTPDIYKFVKEAELPGKRIGKIIENPGCHLFEIRGDKKKFMKIRKDGIYFSEFKVPAPKKPSNFVMHLRKHLEGKIIDEASLLGWDRVVKIRTGERSIIFELFGRGNIILVKEGKILDALHKRRWSARDIIPKAEYKPPPSSINIFEFEKENFKKYEKPLVNFMVRELGLGNYAEEILKNIDIEKTKKTNELSGEEAEKIIQEINTFLKNVPDKNWDEIFKEKEKEKRKGKIEEKREEKTGKYRRMLEAQKKTLERYKKEREKSRKIAEFISGHLYEIGLILKGEKGKFDYKLKGKDIEVET